MIRSLRVNRRKMLAALAAGGSSLLAQEPAGIDPTLYIPKAHLVEDRKLLQDFMDEYSFADLVTSSPTLRITHIPVILDRTAGAYGKIIGHVSRQNPQSQTFDGRHTGLIVFRGPHGYISPTWYAKTDVVPTWNFAVVHASGRPTGITEKAALHDLLARLIDKFESYQGSGYDFSKLPDGYVSSLMGGIVGFEMPIESRKASSSSARSGATQISKEYWNTCARPPDGSGHCTICLRASTSAHPKNRRRLRQTIVCVQIDFRAKSSATSM